MNTLPAAQGDSELAQAGWRKSRRSNGSDTCVEVGCVANGPVVRDSTDPNGDVLFFSPRHWGRFLDDTRGRGERSPL
jgi:hypothetical protein